MFSMWIAGALPPSEVAMHSSVHSLPALQRRAALAALEDRYPSPRRAAELRDAAEERSLAWAMVGLSVGFFVGGPLAGLAGLALGALAGAGGGWPRG